MNTHGPTAPENILRLRARVLAAIRAFFTAAGYLEVETPIRIPVPAPETHIDPQPCETWVLQTSPELCMKRLLAAGYGQIFQICKCFRRNERGQRHLPEMTMLEWYTAEATYEQMMNQCEELMASLGTALGLEGPLTYQGQEIHLQRPWPKLTVAEAFEKYAPVSMQAALETDRFDEIMGIDIEPHLGRKRPVFLCDYPTSHAALARRKPEAPDVAERFELYMGGLELCNAFGELTDPKEQRLRFEAVNSQRQAMGSKIYPLPERFLSALAHMPTAAGNALGLDRLIMLLTGSDCIDQVVAFTPEAL